MAKLAFEALERPNRRGFVVRHLRKPRGEGRLRANALERDDAFRCTPNPAQTIGAIDDDTSIGRGRLPVAASLAFDEPTSERTRIERSLSRRVEIAADDGHSVGQTARKRVHARGVDLVAGFDLAVGSQGDAHAAPHVALGIGRKRRVVFRLGRVDGNRRVERDLAARTPGSEEKAEQMGQPSMLRANHRMKCTLQS